MYIPDFSEVLLGRRAIVTLDKSRFALDTSGVAGFFGGTEAVSAMATVHILRHRKRWGWYNSPGSYEVAKRYGLLTRFGFLFGGGHADPAELLSLFELDGRKGPQYLRVHSGTIIPETEHLAAVFMNAFAPPQRPQIPGKKQRQPVTVTIAMLDRPSGDDRVLKPIRTPSDSRLLASIPIVVSVGACAACAVNADWYSFSLILWGIIANGVSCAVIGSIRLKFVCPRLVDKADQSGQPRDVQVAKLGRVSGILVTPTNIVLLKGREDAAMAVAFGKFVLPAPDGRSFRNQLIGLCSILLLLQFFAQLLIIPQGTLFGQIMFVASLGVSWCYNLWLCSVDKGVVQQRILLENILNLQKDDVKGYPLDNWPATVLFVLLTLVFEDGKVDERKLGKVLKALVEDDSEVWRIWKSSVLDWLQRARAASEGKVEAPQCVEVPEGEKHNLSNLSTDDARMLNALLDEAWSGVEEYKKRNGDGLLPCHDKNEYAITSDSV